MTMSEHTPGPCPNCGVNASEVMPLVVKLRLQRDELLAALEAALARFRYIRTGGTGVESADPAYLVGNEDVIRQLAAALKAAKGE